MRPAAVAVAHRELSYSLSLNLWGTYELQWDRDNRIWDRLGRDNSRIGVSICLFLSALAFHFLADALFGASVIAYYFDDFLAPIMLLSTVSFLSATTGQRWFDTRAGTVSVMSFAIIVWEGIAPLILRDSTADWIDLVAYCLGAVLFRLIVETLNEGLQKFVRV